MSASHILKNFECGVAWAGAHYVVQLRGWERSWKDNQKTLVWRVTTLPLTCPPESAGSSSAGCRHPGAARCGQWMKAPRRPHSLPPLPLTLSTCSPLAQSCPAFFSYTCLCDPSVVFSLVALLVDLWKVIAGLLYWFNTIIMLETYCCKRGSGCPDWLVGTNSFWARVVGDD